MVEPTRNIPVGEHAWWPHMLDPLKQLGSQIAEFFTPSADAAATSANYEIELELPGVTEKDIEVTVHENLLTIQGEKRFEKKEETKEYFFSERHYGAFRRNFRLPDDALADDIGADFHNGILKLTIPKREVSEPKPKRIEIQSRH